MAQENVFLNILLIISSVVLLLIAGFLIPCLLQIVRTAKGLSLTLQMLNESLPGILRNLEEIAGQVNRTAGSVHQQVEDLSVRIKTIQGTVGLLMGIEEIIRRKVPLPLTPIIRLSMSLAKGVGVFVSHLLPESREGKEEPPAAMK